MHPVVLLSTAVLAGYFVYLIVGTWRLSHGHGRLSSRKERLALATLLAIVAWQAMRWIHDGHPEASEGRRILVWVQLLTAFGSAVVLLILGWVAKPKASSTPS